MVPEHGCPRLVEQSPPRVGRWLLLALCLALGSTCPAHGEPPSAARTDRYGDPLPEEVIARAGTVRWRHAGVFLVSFGPDGKSLVSVGGGTLRWWDPATGKELQRLNTGRPGLNCAALSVDGKLLAQACEDSTVCIYNTDTGAEISHIRPARGWVASLTFTSDGKVLASKPAFGATVTLWEVHTGKKVRELKPSDEDEQDLGGGAVSASRGLALSPDGQYLAAGSEDGIKRAAEGADVQCTDLAAALGQSILVSGVGARRVASVVRTSAG